MDTLTHALSGALLARATAPVPAADVLPLRRRIAIGALAAAFPDIDVVVSWLSPLAYLYHHRGVTHSLLMLVVWTALLAWLCTKVWPNGKNKGPGWRAYAGVIAWGIAAHIAGDWITSFGTMVLAPLSDWRAALSTTFIIDLWFSGIILAGLLASWAWRRSRWPAVAGLSVLCAYVVFQFAMQQRAIAFGEHYASASGLRDARVSAMPRPVSPFNWMVIVETEDRYHYSLISLSARDAPTLAADAGFFARLAAPYLPLDKAHWDAQHAGAHPGNLRWYEKSWRNRNSLFSDGLRNIPCFIASTLAIHRPAYGFRTCAFSRRGGPRGLSAMAYAGKVPGSGVRMNYWATIRRCRFIEVP